MKKILCGLVAVLLSISAQAELKTQVIEYQIGGDSYTGYLAYDDSQTGKRPGVLVVHEWWGHNDYVRKRAEMLAGLGYTAFALDMYGTGKLAQHPQDATNFMQAVVSNMNVAERRFEAAFNLLRNHPTVESEKIAALGYCFGGATSLHMARQGLDLDGVASFHGALGSETAAEKGKVKGEVIIFTGEADPMIPAEDVSAFHQEMTNANVAHSIYSYPGAKHGFTNPAADDFGKRFNLPLAYDAAADADSWLKTRDFLAKVFNR